MRVFEIETSPVSIILSTGIFSRITLEDLGIVLRISFVDKAGWMSDLECNAKGFRPFHLVWIVYRLAVAIQSTIPPLS